nr:MAG TPA: hypothetical protein [Caudoviricetes sp.]
MKKDKEQDPCLFLFIGRLNSIFPPFPTRCRFFIFWAVLFFYTRRNYKKQTTHEGRYLSCQEKALI